jgi:hypothetical protein
MVGTMHACVLRAAQSPSACVSWVSHKMMGLSGQALFRKTLVPNRMKYFVSLLWPADSMQRRMAQGLVLLAT